MTRWRVASGRYATGIGVAPQAQRERARSRRSGLSAGTTAPTAPDVPPPGGDDAPFSSSSTTPRCCPPYCGHRRECRRLPGVLTSASLSVSSTGKLPVSGRWRLPGRFGDRCRQRGRPGLGAVPRVSPWAGGRPWTLVECAGEAACGNIQENAKKRGSCPHALGSGFMPAREEPHASRGVPEACRGAVTAR